MVPSANVVYIYTHLTCQCCITSFILDFLPATLIIYKIFWQNMPIIVWCLGKRLFSSQPPGGYSHFFLKRRLWPSIYCLPQKYIRNSRHTPKNIISFSNSQNIFPSCTHDLRKDPNIHRNEPKNSPVLQWPPKNIHKFLIHQKYLYFWKLQKVLKFKFWTPKNGPSLHIYENIRIPPGSQPFIFLLK